MEMRNNDVSEHSTDDVNVDALFADSEQVSEMENYSNLLTRPSAHRSPAKFWATGDSGVLTYA